MFVTLPGWMLSSGALPGCAWTSTATLCGWLLVWGGLTAGFLLLLRPGWRGPARLR